MPEQEAQRRALLGRMAGLLFVAGGIASFPANALLSAPRPSLLVHVVDVLALVSGVVCLAVPWRRVSGLWLHVVIVVATAEVALTQWSVGRHGDVHAWYFVLVAVFTGYAISERRALAAHLTFLFGAFWLPAILHGVGYRTGPDPVSHALVGGPVLLVSAGMIIFLRERLEAEQAELRALASRAYRQSITDALTDLGNRRKLLRDLDDALADGFAARPRRLVLFDLNGFKAYNDAFGHPAGDALLRRLGLALAAAVDGHGTAYRLGGDEFCVLLDAASLAADPLPAAMAALEEEGELFSISAAHGIACVPGEARTAADAIGIADQRMYAAKNGRNLSAARQSCEVLVRLLTERQPDLGHHLQEVAELARGVARELGLETEEVDEIVRAAQLHDVGKSAIPEAILDKPGPLDAEEWEFIRRHTLIGERILRAAPALAPVARIVRASHERVDGAGYPDGIPAAEIPLGARIVAVCDAFHAMTSPDRPYREPLSRDEALEELEACAGTQFDPAIVRAFRATLRDAAPAVERLA